MATVLSLSLSTGTGEARRTLPLRARTRTRGSKRGFQIHPGNISLGWLGYTSCTLESPAFRKATAQRCNRHELVLAGSPSYPPGHVAVAETASTHTKRAMACNATLVQPQAEAPANTRKVATCLT